MKDNLHVFGSMAEAKRNHIPSWKTTIYWNYEQLPLMKSSTLTQFITKAIFWKKCLTVSVFLFYVW